MRLLLTHADHNQKEILELVSPHYQAFAEHNSMDFHASNDNASSPYYLKIKLIKEALQKYDEVLFIDNDFVLLTKDNPFDELKEDDFQALCLEQTPHGIGPNTGFWILKQKEETFEFLNKVIKEKPVDSLLNDQASVAFQLGFTYLPSFTKPVYPSNYLKNTGWLDWKWNVLRVFNKNAFAFAKAVHFGGMDKGQKIALIKQALIDERLPGWENCLSDKNLEKINNKY